MARLSPPLALSLNFDSLNEAYGFPHGYKDPSFYTAFDRFADLANKYGIKLSIYIIAKDLENPDHFSRVREWAKAGHEIGNHTWSHPTNLGTLKESGMQDEIKRAHDLISDCAGYEPKGFIAPNWSMSTGVLRQLIDLKYEYDTSVFPSFMLYALVARVAANHLFHGSKLVKLFQRRDWLYPMNKPNEPFLVDRNFKNVNSTDSLLILPVPTAHRMRPAIWHTVGFTFGWSFVKNEITKILDRGDCFYYLMHPGDFIGPEELHPTYSQYLARMDVPLEKKMNAIEDIFKVLKDSGRELTNMRGLAKYYRNQLLSKTNIEELAP